MIRLPRSLRLGAALALALAVAVELAFGSWLFGPSYGVLNVPRDEVRVFDVSKLYAGGGRVEYRRDSHGLRGPHEHPSRIDLLVIGGSAANERYTAFEETWAGVLGRRFAARGRPLTVASAALDGQSTAGLIRNFEDWFPLVPGLKPRAVLAYVGAHDMVLTRPTDQDRLRSSDWSRRLRHFFRNHSAWYGAARTIQRRFKEDRAEPVLGPGHAFGIRWVKAEPQPDLAAARLRLGDRLDAFRARVRRLAESIRALGAVPIFVAQPRIDFRLDGDVVSIPHNAYAIDAVLSFELSTLFGRELMETCREAGGVCIDLLLEPSFADGDFYDRIRATPKGSLKIGDFLFARLSAIL
jgi:hypothetical protein